MKLKDLAGATDTSTASIKYYIRLGILAPGAKKNATTAVYQHSHVERLELIAALRRIVGASIEDISRLTALIDDPDVPFLRIMKEAQEIASGIAQTPATGGGTGAAVTERVAVVMTQHDWPDVNSTARLALERVLTEMAALGLSPSDDYLRRVATAMNAIGMADLQMSGSRDRIAMQVAVGTHSYARLVLAVLRLSQTSQSIRSFGGQHG